MDKKDFVIEAYPDHIQAKIEKRDRQKAMNAPNKIGDKIFNLVLEDLKLWRVGIIKVSFKGGDSELHQKIANVADGWTSFGNISFDFGYNSGDKSYRLWHDNDNSHIRVGFEYDGYWSLVGNDSTDTSIVGPGDVTLNLSKFDTALPNGWEGTVLHEFGHALGFHHEHQSPDLKCDFDWPMLYDYLGGSPNYWPKSKVDHNLRQLTDGIFTWSAHDKYSIMHYSFPSWMFISKDHSPCFTDENFVLSAEDKAMISKAYPRDEQMIAKIDKERIDNLHTLMAAPKISKDLKSLHSEHLEYYQAFQ